VKYDGDRAILFIANGKVIIQNRRGVDMTYRYPELQVIANGRNMVLDGEIVYFDEHGVSDFGKFAQRSHLQKAFDIELRMKAIPVTFVAFDLLELDGQEILSKPLHERKSMLYQCTTPIAGVFAWSVPLDKEGKGRAIFEMAKRLGWEGIVGKHMDSPYLQGKRSPYWKKVKNVKTVDMVFVRYEINNAGIKLWAEDGITTVQCTGAQHWAVKKEIDEKGSALVEVKYLNLTENGRLRQPTFKALKKGGYIQ